MQKYGHLSGTKVSSLAGTRKTVPGRGNGDKESELSNETLQKMGQRVDVGRKDEGAQTQGQGSLTMRETVGESWKGQLG